MILGEVIKELRQGRNLTQEQICRMANITQGYYSTIENGSTPSIEVLIKLADIFELPLFLLIWAATQKSDIPIKRRKLYNIFKPYLDNLLQEEINKK